ncbi:MAG: TIGR02757 family protein [Deferrisomatales bacterium]|nr:TIGR02757 family protein [Deferrisomatales bacterium]
MRAGSAPGRAGRRDRLGKLLEGLYRRHHRLERLEPDPLVFARRYGRPEDGEVAGLVAAALAYGQVEQIVATLGGVFAALGPCPARLVRESSPDALGSLTRGFSYRFHKQQDLALFLHLVGQVLERHGSLREAFLAGDAGGELGPALTAFAGKVLGGDPRPFLPRRSLPEGHPVRHLLPCPARGGASKRLCLYLRWMVRRDALDPGFWHGAVDPARLVVPLDTHVARVGRGLGLTARKTADWKTACEVTRSLRRYDPGDPVRFDFSLFRFGMGRGM